MLDWEGFSRQVELNKIWTHLVGAPANFLVLAEILMSESRDDTVLASSHWYRNVLLRLRKYSGSSVRGSCYRGLWERFLLVKAWNPTN